MCPPLAEANGFFILSGRTKLMGGLHDEINNGAQDSFKKIMNTLPQLLSHQARTRGAKVAMRAKRLGLWKSLTWDDVQVEVRRFACGLADAGVVKGDAVAVIGGNVPRIFCAITACQSIGAVPMPIYGNLAGEELVERLKKVAPRYVVAEDQQQVDAVLGLASLGISFELIIYTAGRGMSGYDPRLVRDFEGVQKRGDEYLAAHPGCYTEAVAAGSGDDPALILFTSGVEVHPKALVLRHRHVINVAEYVAEAEKVTEADEVLSFMPIFLPTNLLCGYILSHVTGMCLSCPENAETVMENLREVSPSVLFAPPHVYKQIRATIRERIELTRGLSRRLYDNYMKRMENGEEASRNKRSLLGDVLVAAPIRELYGLNHLRLAFTGGDAISRDVFMFFDSLGVELKQIYGTTETLGFTTMQVEERTEKNVGHAVSGMEVKIAANGEVMCRGENVCTEYYEDEATSAAALDQDGWFHTGDVGVMSGSGQLTVVDRLSALGKLRDGATFMPKVIEKEIKESLYINEAFVHGDGEESLVAVVTIDGETVSAWANHNDVRYTGYADLASKPEVLALIRQEVEEANRRLAAAGDQPEVAHFLIFNRQLAPQTEELTWTHKMRRSVMAEHFSAMLQALHAGQGSFAFDDPRSGSRIDFRISSF